MDSLKRLLEKLDEQIRTLDEIIEKERNENVKALLSAFNTINKMIYVLGLQVLEHEKEIEELRHEVDELKDKVESR